MDLRIDALFSDDPELPDHGPHDLEAVLLALGGADTPHAEDVFLAEFARWLCAREPSASERRAAIDFARDALEHVGDPDGAWQGLPVERLLQRAERDDVAAAGVRHARALVGWLGNCGRLSLHGQRVLTRRIGAVRIGVQPVQRAMIHGPRLAA